MCAGRLVAVLAEAAARPGAGLETGPPLSVVVTVLNEGEGIDRLLATLVPQVESDDELIVVDGGSSDDTALRVESWSRRDPRVRLIEAPGTNIPRGRNAGIAAARRDHIACTDAGCAPSPGWLRALRSAFADNPPPALVAGVYRVSEHGPFQAAMAASSYAEPEEARRPGPLVRAYGRLLGRTFDAAMPAARSIAFTKEAWEAVGGFPAHLDTAEDPAFGRKVAATGRRCVLQADAEVVWEQRPTVASTARMYFRYGVGGGLSGDRKIIGRDVARLVAYAGGPLLWWRGGRVSKAAVAAAAAWYLSLPLWRVRRRRRPVAVAALVPLALVVKDLSKSVGCLAGLARRHRGPTGGEALRAPGQNGGSQ
jgi:glycosyltransferase involved in cell wall biosynthesis